MIIKAIHTSKLEILESNLIDKNYHWLDEDFLITRNKHYVVYGITYFNHATPSKKHFNPNEQIWYGDFYYTIINDYGLPSIVLSRMFEVVCPHLYGEGWCFQHYEAICPDASGSLGFKRFVVDTGYASRLLLLAASKAERLEWLEWKEYIDACSRNATCNCCEEVDKIIDSSSFDFSYISEPLSDNASRLTENPH